MGGLFIAGMAGAVVGLRSGQTIINASLVSFNSISCHNVTSLYRIYQFDNITPFPSVFL